MSTSSDAAEDDRIVAKCYVELGNVTKEKGDYDESLSYHRRSMEIFERIEDPLGLADSHLNIAEIYKVKGELKQAMSEYEKGLSLYEDVYVDDANKSSDSGTDVSLNSSSFCDQQHLRSLSKSEEILPQTTLLDAIEKHSTPSPPRLSTNNAPQRSTSSLNLINSSPRHGRDVDDAAQLTSSVDDSALVLSKKLTDTLLKSLASSRASDLQNLDDPDLFLPITPSDMAYETTAGTTPDGIEFNESYGPCSTQSKMNSVQQNSTLNNLEEISSVNDHKQNDLHRHGSSRLPNKHLLVIFLAVFLASAFCWSLREHSPNKSKVSGPSGGSSAYSNSRNHHHARDDLSKQLRKLLAWRKNQVASLDRDTRRAIEDLISSGSDSRSKLTVDKFQKILDMLDLRLVLVPR